MNKETKILAVFFVVLALGIGNLRAEIIEINITTVEGSDGIAGNHHYVVVDLHETNGLPIRVAQSYPNEDSWDIESNQAVLELYEGRWEWL